MKLTESINQTGYHVYRIKNIVNNKEYIGSTKNIKYRIEQHLMFLKNNKHYNKFLQKDFNVYGADAFVIEIIDTTNDEKILRMLEKHYISKCNCLYNMSIYENGQWTVPTMYTEYPAIIGPDGIIYESGIHCESMAKSIGVSKSQFSRFINGKVKVCNGFRLYNEGTPYERFSADILCPNGEVKYINNVNIHSFCKENKLKYKNIINLINGLFDKGHHKEFRLYNNGNPIEIYNFIKDPDGNIHKFANPYNFSKEHDISQPRLSDLINGNSKECSGWTMVYK